MNRRTGLVVFAAASVLALVFVACSRAPDTAPSDPGIEAGQLVTQVAGDVGTLRHDVTELRDEIDALKAAEVNTAGKLDTALERLWNAIDRLEASMDDTRDGAEAAAANASSAISEARAAARTLAVLESRLDYHIRHNH